MEEFNFEKEWLEQGTKTATKKPMKVPFVIATGTVTIKTHGGTVTAHKGDIIAKNLEGELYPISKEIFKRTYNIDKCELSE